MVSEEMLKNCADCRKIKCECPKTFGRKELELSTYTKCPKCTTDFSCFFLHATPEQKKELLTEVARQANEDQRAMVEEAREKIIR